MQRVKCLSSGGGHNDCNLPLKLLSLPGDLNFLIQANQVLKPGWDWPNVLKDSKPTCIYRYYRWRYQVKSLLQDQIRNALLRWYLKIINCLDSKKLAYLEMKDPMQRFNLPTTNLHHGFRWLC